jgi:hypothetical protein
MMRHLLSALATLPLLAACSLDNDVTRVSGAETRSIADSPRIVPAGFVQTREGTRMELVTADGSVMSGLLTLRAVPIIVPLAATDTPLVGGGTELAGELTAANGQVMICSFRLMNPPRGVDGGGSGRCEGGGRRVDFLF